MHWKIEIRNPRSGHRRSLSIDRDAVTVGRCVDSDVVISDSHVSRRHLSLVFPGEGIPVLVDHQSMNGTFLQVGGSWEKVSGKRPLQLPSKVMVGGETLLTVDHDSSGYSLIADGDPSESIARSVLHDIDHAGRFQAIMVLDLCGSARIASADETAAFHMKRRLESISRPLLEAANMDFYKNTGDGFLATFGGVADAYGAARSILAAIIRRNARSRNPAIDVRVSLHVGQIFLIDEAGSDVHGSALNLAFRVEGIQANAFTVLNAAFPERNRVLCTRTFVEELNKAGAHTADLVLCGAAKLKGIPGEVEVYLVPLA